MILTVFALTALFDVCITHEKGLIHSIQHRQERGEVTPVSYMKGEKREGEGEPFR